MDTYIESQHFLNERERVGKKHNYITDQEFETGLNLNFLKYYQTFSRTEYGTENG